MRGQRKCRGCNGRSVIVTTVAAAAAGAAAVGRREKEVLQSAAERFFELAREHEAVAPEPPQHCAVKGAVPRDGIGAVGAGLGPLGED